jgi:hypothetical protein
LQSFRRSAAAAASIDLKRSWLHGDFKTDNLIVSGQRIVGIDLQIKHENAVSMTWRHSSIISISRFIPLHFGGLRQRVSD